MFEQKTKFDVSPKIIRQNANIEDYLSLASNQHDQALTASMEWKRLCKDKVICNLNTRIQARVFA